MPTHVALLRGVNLAGRRMVPMAELRGLAAELGLAGAQTLLQSGNLVFGSERRSAYLERLLQAEAERRLGLRTELFVRTAREWAEAVAHNPFREAAEKDPSHLVVVFLKDAPGAKSVKALQAAITGPEVVRAWDRHAYITYPAGIGDSRLTAAVIDRALGTRGTARNWNTVLKLAALVGS